LPHQRAAGHLVVDHSNTPDIGKSPLNIFELLGELDVEGNTSDIVPYKLILSGTQSQTVKDGNTW
jgi:hypothetical protein